MVRNLVELCINGEQKNLLIKGMVIYTYYNITLGCRPDRAVNEVYDQGNGVSYSDGSTTIKEFTF